MNEQQWSAWRSLPETEAFFSLLLRIRAGAMEQWANGNLANESEFGTKFLNGQAIGACKLIQDLLEMSHQTFESYRDEE